MDGLIAGALLAAMEFLGIEWHLWKVIGWLGNIAFSLRFFVQWYATEKREEVVIPVAFWWLSLVGSTLLLSYAVFHQQDSVFIFAYAFTWIPYIRNLVIHRNARKTRLTCCSCRTASPHDAKFCSECGQKFTPESELALPTGR